MKRQTSGAPEAWCDRNGYTLDKTLNLHDEGVSGFKGKNVEVGRLGAFLERVREGSVVAGSALIVENLDRLTRDYLPEALSLFLELIRAEIKIVTLNPEQVFEKSKLDTTMLMFVIMELSRGHGESARKAELSGANWKNKRSLIGVKKLTARGPAWLTLSADKTTFATVPEKAEVVRRVFRMTIEGAGIEAIARTLNAEEAPPLAHGKGWHKSSVRKILTNRAVLGEFQPHTGRLADRKPIGEVVKDYYPAVIGEEDFYRAQSAMTSRRLKRGPIGKTVANLFTGLVRCADDGATMVLVDKGPRSSGPALVSSSATRGRSGSKYVSFPYAPFEEAMLAWTKEIRPVDVIPPQADQIELRDRIAALEGRIVDLDARLAVFREKLLTAPDFATLLDTVEKLEKERDSSLRTLERLKLETIEAKDNVVDHVQDLVSLVERAEGEELYDLRMRLRSRFASLISEIWVEPAVLAPKERQLLVQVHFKRGGYRRIIILAQHGKLREWANGAIKEGSPDWYDLRDPERHAKLAGRETKQDPTNDVQP